MKECLDEMRSQASLKPLIWSDCIKLAAIDHNNDLIKNNFAAHNGSDGSTPHERIEKHCDVMGTTAENL